jgi:hypothetical protein
VKEIRKMDRDKILKSMTNLSPEQEQCERIEELRSYYKMVVGGLDKLCKDSRELSIAITKLEESLMWAIKNIVLEA